MPFYVDELFIREDRWPDEVGWPVLPFLQRSYCESSNAVTVNPPISLLGVLLFIVFCVVPIGIEGLFGGGGSEIFLVLIHIPYKIFLPVSYFLVEQIQVIFSKGHTGYTIYRLWLLLVLISYSHMLG